ncbi:hypothetical protein [Cumulibacter manganitolerans]|uniref:hypothetical protein n=1 Tax=Cumulibacter manganitolerans TaxID=1884992 RepID=UPI001297023B|nr:hypothetical protein [Cumulibacter manganitolerans]
MAHPDPLNGYPGPAAPPSPPDASRRPAQRGWLREYRWWVAGLGAMVLALVTAIVLAVTRPFGPGSDWSVFAPAPAATGATLSAADLQKVLDGVAGRLPAGASIETFDYDSDGLGYVTGCSADEESLELELYDLEVDLVEPMADYCPGLITLEQIDAAAVADAVQQAGAGSGWYIDVMVGYVDYWAPGGPEEPLIGVSVDGDGPMLFELDGTPVDGGGSWPAPGPMSPPSAFDAAEAGDAIAAVVTAGELATASSICIDTLAGEYVVIGQRADDPATSTEWHSDYAVWEGSSWPTAGPAPVAVQTLDVAAAIDLLPQVTAQQQHNFPISSICAAVAGSAGYEVTYSGLTGYDLHAVVTDSAGAVLRQS